MTQGKAEPLSTIKNRRDFLAAATGRKWVTGTLILQTVARNSEHPAAPAPRVGFTVTKRMGNAVARNRIKRRLREAVKKTADTARPGQDYVIISRPRALFCPFSELLRDMAFAFSRIEANKGASPKDTK